VEALQSAPDVMDAAVFGNALHLVVRMPRAPFRAASELSCRRGITVTRMEKIRPSLEDVFVSLTTGSECGRGAQAMSLTRMLAIARKEVVQILRDSRSLIIVVLMPAVLVLLFRLRRQSRSEGLPVYVWIKTAASRARTC
jgi:hypothetical protein